MTSDLVPVDNMAALDAMGPQAREAAVTNMLAEARSWLAHAVEATRPVEIANFKAQMATVADAARRLSLSREIQTDALEMVRRAERSVAVAVRKGQAAGEITRIGDGGGVPMPGVSGSVSRSSLPESLDTRPRPKDYFANGEEQVDAYVFAAASDEEFEAALTEARSEGSISRANVVRKVKRQQSPVTRDQRADLVRKLASEGWTSRQIVTKVGVGPDAIRRIAADYGIEIPADKVMSNTRRINANTTVENVVSSLAALAGAVELIDHTALDITDARYWVDSLADSFRRLNRFHAKIKETVR